MKKSELEALAKQWSYQNPGVVDERYAWREGFRAAFEYVVGRLVERHHTGCAKIVKPICTIEDE